MPLRVFSLLRSTAGAFAVTGECYCVMYALSSLGGEEISSHAHKTGS